MKLRGKLIVDYRDLKYEPPKKEGRTTVVGSEKIFFPLGFGFWGIPSFLSPDAIIKVTINNNIGKPTIIRGTALELSQKLKKGILWKKKKGFNDDVG